MMSSGLPVWEKLAKKMIWNQIGSLKGKTILDFGSGSGITANYYAADNHVTAIEPSEAMLSEQVNTNGYRQMIGSADKLKELPGDSFDFIICHNVLEYVEDKKEIIGEFYRLLKRGGRLSIVKHNRNGRIMQMVVLLNDFDEADRLFDGGNSSARQFGTIHYYEDSEVEHLCGGFVLKRTFGVRTFWDLQQNQEVQQDRKWQEKMIEIETRAAENQDFQKIAFFHHLIFEKE